MTDSSQRHSKLLLALTPLLLAACAEIKAVHPTSPPPAATNGQVMGACGTLNSEEATYVTEEECSDQGGIFVAGVQPYENMFVVDRCTHTSTTQAQITFAIMRPKPGQQAQLKQLAAQFIQVLRQQGHLTERIALTMESNSDGTIFQMLEWKQGGAEAAHQDPVVHQVWADLEQASVFLPMGQLEEQTCAFPTFALLEEL